MLQENTPGIHFTVTSIPLSSDVKDHLRNLSQNLGKVKESLRLATPARSNLEIGKRPDYHKLLSAAIQFCTSERNQYIFIGEQLSLRGGLRLVEQTLSNYSSVVMPSSR